MLFPALRFLAEPADNCVYERKGDNTMRFFRFLFFTFILLWMLIGCRQSTSPPVKSDITLTAEFTGVTEAWIKVHNPSPQAEAVLQLWRGDVLVFSGGGNITDTTVADSGLSPAQSYRYRARLLKNGALLRTGPELTITTMDTTSHDFSFQEYVLESPYSGASLFDVAIINENDIWAVGEIYSDSAKPWLPYNAVHWNGERWEFKRINYSGSPWPIRSVYATSANNIWFDSFVRWNGEKFIEVPIPNVLIGHRVIKLWGISDEKIFVVGSEGLIVTYNGNSWQKIESGTQTRINDIYGIAGNNANPARILCAVGEVFHQEEDRAILSIQPDNSVTRFPWPTDVDIHSVWMNNAHKTYACGSGIWMYSNKKWNEIKELPPNWWYRIRGTADNNIWACGDRGVLAHFNGKDWAFYKLYVSMMSYYDVDILNDLIVVVGFSIRNAHIIIIRRNS